jgi:hypothetical protein
MFGDDDKHCKKLATQLMKHTTKKGHGNRPGFSMYVCSQKDCPRWIRFAKCDQGMIMQEHQDHEDHIHPENGLKKRKLAITAVPVFPAVEEGSPAIPAVPAVPAAFLQQDNLIQQFMYARRYSEAYTTAYLQPTLLLIFRMD